MDLLFMVCKYIGKHRESEIIFWAADYRRVRFVLFFHHMIPAVFGLKEKASGVNDTITDHAAKRKDPAKKQYSDPNHASIHLIDDAREKDRTIACRHSKEERTVENKIYLLIRRHTSGFCNLYPSDFAKST